MWDQIVLGLLECFLCLYYIALSIHDCIECWLPIPCIVSIAKVISHAPQSEHAEDVSYISVSWTLEFLHGSSNS
ncbi:hypothetical protein L208DRAFT_1392995 [Tricholoma matsutake]|nr:hypothetical protein L208DRAFT_1392995 [Tricholoma matsutake 945]